MNLQKGKVSKMTTLNLTPKEVADKKRIKFAVVGMLWAWISGVTTVTQGCINTIISGGVNLEVNTTIVTFVVAYAILGMNDILAGIFMILNNIVHGRNLKEHARAIGTKLGNQMILGSFFGGACATGLVMTAYNLAGLTYTAILISTSPIITAIVGRIVFKETVNARMYVGIVIAVVGICLAGFAPPTGEVYPKFALGLLLAGLAPLFFTAEGMVATYATDLLDPNIGCALFRGVASGIMILIVGGIIGALNGYGGLIFHVMGMILTTPTLLVGLVCMAIASCFSYMGTYVAFNMTGPTRCLAVVNTLPIWSIPVGLIFAALGLQEYNVTGQAIVGAFVIVIGILLVIANPKELVSLRDVE